MAFFLSLCALSFLANYVLSAKMLHDEIRKNGADLIIVFDTVRDGEPSKKNLLQHELPSLYGCDVLVLNDARAGVARVGKTVFPILEYNMESCSFLSALGLEDVATVLLYNPSRSPLQAGPCTVTIADFDFSLNASLCRRGICWAGCILPESFWPRKEPSVPDRRFPWKIAATSSGCMK
ncbi:hypothetical protein C1I94_02500 [Akkermansia muciniphila]|nr:hypothetical protein C1I94_02500 [Akkermansia muciniphila]